jgi:pentose-5-phosphate-3-epimerase
LVDAGVNAMVAGNAIFGAKDPKAAITEMKSI